MVNLQRWTQIAWLSISVVPLYSNYVHSGADRFELAALLWVLLAVGTVLLFSRRAPGLVVSAIAATLVLLTAGPWALRELMTGIPHGSPRVGNPVSIFVGLFYLVFCLTPAVLVLLLSWGNRRAFSRA